MGQLPEYFCPLSFAGNAPVVHLDQDMGDGGQASACQEPLEDRDLRAFDIELEIISYEESLFMARTLQRTYE